MIYYYIFFCAVIVIDTGGFLDAFNPLPAIDEPIFEEQANGTDYSRIQKPAKKAPGAPPRQKSPHDIEDTRLEETKVIK